MSIEPNQQRVVSCKKNLTVNGFDSNLTARQVNQRVPNHAFPITKCKFIYGCNKKSPSPNKYAFKAKF